MLEEKPLLSRLTMRVRMKGHIPMPSSLESTNTLNWYAFEGLKLRGGLCSSIGSDVLLRKVCMLCRFKGLIKD